MSRKKLTIYWAALATLVAALWITGGSDENTAQEITELQMGDALLSNFDGNAIKTIELRTPRDLTKLTRTNETWKVEQRDNFPARKRAIFDGLRKLSNLRVIQAIDASPEQWQQFGLDPESWETPGEGENLEQILPLSLTLESGKGSEKHQLIVGNTTSVGGAGAISGRYVRRVGDDSGVYIVDDPFTDWNAFPAYWIDRGLIDISSPMRIEFRAPAEPRLRPWVLQRSSLNDILRLQDQSMTERLSPEAITPLGKLFQPLQIREVFTEQQVQRVYNKQLERIITIDTANGIRMTLMISPTGEIRPGKEADLWLIKPIFEKSPLYKSKRAEAALASLKPAEGRVFLAGKIALAPANRPRFSLLEKQRVINPGER